MRATALAADLLGNTPLGVTGNVNLSNTTGTAPLEIKAANITLGTAARPVNNLSVGAGTAVTGERRDAILEADNRLDMNLAGNLSMDAGTATASSATSAVTSADAIIRSKDTRAVIAGNIDMTGGTAIIGPAAGATQVADANAIFRGDAFTLQVGGDVGLTAGSASAATGGNTATANSQIFAKADFAPVINGDLNLLGGTADAQPVSGQFANAVAAASLESDGKLSLKVLGNSTLQAGSATSINTGGGMFAESDAGAFVRSNNDAVDINISQDFMITGGTAIATGTNLRAVASAGVKTGDIASGVSLLINTLGDMSLTGGVATGAAADAAALVYSASEAKLTIGGPSGLRLEGGTGPFFPPFGSGVFTPDSDLFHLIGDSSLVRILGSAYPITVTGTITLVPNPSLGAALFISEAPPLSLDSLLAAFIKSTDCVSFSGGACTLSEATSIASKGSKGAAGGVCK